MENTGEGVELGILSLRCLWNITAQIGGLIWSDREDTFKMAANRSTSYIQASESPGGREGP